MYSEGPNVYFGRRPLPYVYSGRRTQRIFWRKALDFMQAGRGPHVPCIIKWENRCKFNICDLKIRYSFVGKCNVEIRAQWSRLKPSVVPTLMGVRLLPGVCTTRKL